MRRNRRRKTFHFKAANIGLAVMLVLIAVPWVLYCLLNVSNDQVGAQIRLLEQEVRTQQEALRREEAMWNRLTEPSHLDRAIAESGLRLSYAPPERTITMSTNGRMRMPETLRLQLAQESRMRTGEAMARNAR